MIYLDYAATHPMTPEALAANPCFALVAEYGTNQLWSVCRTD